MLQVRLRTSEEFSNSTEILGDNGARRVVMPRDVRYWTTLFRDAGFSFKTYNEPRRRGFAGPAYFPTVWIITFPTIEEVLTHDEERIRVFAKRLWFLWKET